MQRVKMWLGWCLAGALAVGGCAPGAAQAEPLVFMAGYKPQANLPFVGVYVAQEKGYFTDEGLTVEIQHSPGQGEHLQLTAAGKVQVTTQDAAVLLQRRQDPGLPLVSIALIGQRGQQAFAALEASGIETPKDWEGRTVGYKGTPPPDLFAILDAAGVDASQVNLVNVGFDPRLLTEGKVDVYPVYKSNEPYLIEQWGYPTRLFDAADYGVATLGLTYVTSDDTLAQKPEQLAAFLRAALKGIRYAAENPDEAVEIVMQYAGKEADPAHMKFMLEQELGDAGDLTRLGEQDAARWQDLADMLARHGALKSASIDGVFTSDLLK